MVASTVVPFILDTGISDARVVQLNSGSNFIDYCGCSGYDPHSQQEQGVGELMTDVLTSNIRLLRVQMLRAAFLSKTQKRYELFPAFRWQPALPGSGK
jgi:predicted GH43/DUF377 family glycosyl hydrolase